MSWPQLALAPVLVIYALLMALLLAYVTNYLYLAYVALGRARTSRTPDPPAPAIWPVVTVQLPLYDEMYVAVRLVEAAAALDYPPEALEIQVLDDSDDGTLDLVAEAVTRLRARGVDIHHVRRDRRDGFKAGALAHGLSLARGEFVAVFDADFIPRPDFLRRMLPHFDADGVAFVQARWGHLNAGYSALTILQALSLDAHFAIDQPARSQAGHFFNFNGTAGVWRKAAILGAGGWRADTLTEDLDLSYRAFLRGWTARYAADVEAAAELPVSFNAFRRQQYRWARGSLECAIRLLPAIWRAPVPVVRKLVASLHLTAYGTHFLTLGLILIFPPLLALTHYYPRLLAPEGLGLAANFMFLVPVYYFAVGQHLLRKPWLPRLPVILAMTIFASGLMLNTLSAALDILRKRAVAFERTPKYGIVRRRQDWRGNPYKVATSAAVIFELLLACLTAWTASSAAQTGYWLIFTYSLLFTAGLLFTSGSTLFQAFSQRRVPGSAFP